MIETREEKKQRQPMITLFFCRNNIYVEIYRKCYQHALCYGCIDQCLAYSLAPQSVKQFHAYIFSIQSVECQYFSMNCLCHRAFF